MKKMMIFAALIFSGAFASAEVKVGLVDMQKAVQATSAGKKAKTELEGDFEKKKKELQKKEADLKKMGEDLEKKKSVMSEEALQKKQAEFQEEMMKYRDVVSKSQMDIQKKERDLTQPILEKMRKVIEKIAKEKGYSMILENSAMVLFSDKGLDITDDVIKAFEKEK
ncbi:MAG: OmpH family outer membrane protein [Bdellovibrionaceae bacterium]|nr:OmpH family outer membrane protein [Pseudobdellovibrionaceae bacterium]MBX3035239.1 OmpH family outer membrane protein [Pseudobdellovibrionaceae bacterium]